MGGELDRVRNAIGQSRRTYEDISQHTGLSVDKLSNLLATLVNRGEVKSRSVGDDREFYPTKSAKKGK